MLRNVLCVLLLAASPFARADVNALRRGIENRYRGAKTLKAVFYERYSDGNGGIAAESGTVYFSRPGRMRWDYQSPQQKLFLVDGTNAWFYVPADQTASRARMKESSDWRTPLALIAGKADLSELCRNLDEVKPGSAADDEEGSVTPGDSLLRCTPRDNPVDKATGQAEKIPYVLLESDPNSYLVRVVIHQAGNAETEFRFGKWEENIPIPEIEFHFQPPPGVSIVDEESLANEIH
jgi:outer membrane lipoprotein carrier protein